VPDLKKFPRGPTKQRTTVVRQRLRSELHAALELARSRQPGSAHSDDDDDDHLTV
jgi:hypothetical protein